jgi:hypothetical protein
LARATTHLSGRKQYSGIVQVASTADEAETGNKYISVCTKKYRLLPFPGNLTKQ